MIIEPKRELLLPMRMQGWFRIVAIRPDGRERLLADWFPNLITNAGLNAIGTTSNWMAACRVGTGTAAPDVSDTQLQSHLAGTTSVFSNTASAQAAPPYYGSRTKIFEFAQGTAAGNISEVGIASQANPGGTLFSRALILDGLAQPTTITVLSDETLRVTYQLRVYPQESDINGVINISGTNYDYVMRAANVTDANQWGLSSSGSMGGGPNLSSATTALETQTLADVTGQPAGSNANNSGVSLLPYTSGTFYREYTVTWGLTAANFATGVGSIRGRLGTNSDFGTFQMSFTPKLPKDSTKVLSLTFRHAWARRTI